MRISRMIDVDRGGLEHGRGLGIYWSYHLGNETSYEGYALSDFYVTFYGWTCKEHVDWPETIRMRSEYPDETETRLREGGLVTVDGFRICEVRKAADMSFEIEPITVWT